MSRDTERQRARTLNAPDAGELIKKSLPFVPEHMTAAQLDLVQRVLDAAVVNPAVQKEVDDLDRKSIRSQSGNLVHRDPDMVNRRDKAYEKFILISDSRGADWRVRLDFQKLLAPEALKPTTDNPDEAGYLLGIRATLADRGVWLRFELKWMQNPSNPGIKFYDSGAFRAWLSFGPEGPTIPTDNGALTRKALLGTLSLGAGYWNLVVRGPFQQMLSKAIDRLTDKIKYGMQQHSEIGMDRFIARKISETLGGADYPKMTIWDPPHEILVRALNLNINGNVMASNSLIFIASIMTNNAAKLLHAYVDDMSAGAGRAVKVLSVLETAGHVADCVLVVRAVGMGLLRLASTEAAATSVGAKVGAGAPNVTWGKGALNNTNLTNAKEVYADTLKAAEKGVTMDTGVALNRYAIVNKQAFDELKNGMMELQRRGASYEEKLSFLDRYNAKWGELD